jgi:hypothetical protein
MSVADIEKLHARACRHGSERGITGVVLYADGNIMTCLEGAYGDVGMPYAPMAACGHGKPLGLLDEQVGERLFRGFLMAFQGLQASPALHQATLEWRRFVASAEPWMHTCEAYEMLCVFWRHASRTRYGSR